ncbi:hypothetical protein CORMATOL_01450 [Corynebacterium matruchotii ATCC 33806]|uniref:Uncharacterized protein n=1 Tax=Corynebacterium matruchotii ATCC 33806 TaxID=566549 RepID=C0E388_9CORY|nr:hypothetical protein CORMATOL_01450 [Corynebacterium matruchotii ATCC 33806]
MADSSPAKHNNAVDFPDPLGPTILVILPCSIEQDMPCRTSTEVASGTGNDLCRLCAETAISVILTLLGCLFDFDT